MVDTSPLNPLGEPRGPQTMLLRASMALQAAMKLSTKQTKSLTTVNQKLLKTASLAVGAMGTLAVAFKNVDAIQRRSIAMGTTANRLISQNSEAMKGLEGGFFLPMQEQMSLLEEGLKGNRENLLKLLVHGKLSDQETRNMIDTMVLLEREGGLSRNATESLSRTVLKSAEAYEIQTGKLVESLKALAPELSKTFLIGANKTILEAVPQLAGAVGAANAPLVTKVVKALLDGSDENHAYMGILKTLDQSNIIQRTKSDKEVIKAILQAAKNASQEIRKLTGGVEDSQAVSRMLQSRIDLFGENAIAFAQLQNAIEENGITIQNLSEKALPDFSTSLYQGFLKLIKPIELLSTWLLPKIISNIDILIPAIQGLTAAFTTSYLFRGIGALGGAIKELLTFKGLKVLPAIFLKLIPGVLGIAVALAGYLGWWEKLFGEAKETNKNLAEMNDRDRRKEVTPIGKPTFFFQAAQKMIQEELATKVFGRPMDKSNPDRELYLDMLNELKKVSRGISTLNNSTNRINPNPNSIRK